MSVITISRGSYSHGKEVAERVASRLGYRCVAREVLLEASEHFNIPEVKLIKAFENAPSFLERFSYGKEKYIAYIQAELLKQFQKDNVVYHGLAGHFFVKGVPHVLKVRVIADLEERIVIVRERDGVSRREAAGFLKRIDEERAKWSKSLYGIDTSDPSLYDLVIHLRKFSLDDAVNLICSSVQLKQFQTTAESQKAMDDLTLAAHVKAVLTDATPDAVVTAKEGMVTVAARVHTSYETKMVREIEQIVRGVAGVKGVAVEKIPVTPLDT